MDTIKETERKENIFETTSEEQENYSEQNNIAELSSKR